MPDGPAYAILGAQARPDRVLALNEQLALNRPLWWQYGLWCRHLLHGNLGTSFLQQRSVAAVIGAYAVRTLLLYTTGTALAVAGALCLGLLHGAYYRAWPGRVCSFVELTLYAMPGFFIATLLGMMFSAWLHVLPAGGVVDLRLAAPGIGDRLRHIVLPAASVALFAAPWLGRVLAQSVQAESRRDYVRTARARGVGEVSILLRHILPNSLRPMVTLLGFSLPAIFSGSVVIESVFDYPGLGWLLWRSAVAHDYPVLIGIVLIVGAATMLGNFLADVVCGMLDPRAEFT